MNKPVAVILHPKEWDGARYSEGARFKYVHVSIGGTVPRKVSGIPTYDGYAEVVTPEGTSALVEAFKKYRPYLFLFWIHKGLSAPTMKVLHAISPKTKHVMWYGNHRYTFPRGVAMHKQWLSMVLVNSKDPQQYEMYRNGGIKHVGTLYDGFPEDFGLDEVEPEFDVFFGGNSYQKSGKNNPDLRFPGGLLRYDFICAANAAFNAGVASDAAKGWPFKTLAPSYHPEYTRQLRRAKITLNLNHYPDLWKAYTRRTIRSLHARRCHITLYIPGMEDDFVNHRDLVWFHTIDEGIDQVRYYLDHDREREWVAWNGWEKAKREHTFEVRLREFEKLVEVL